MTGKRRKREKPLELQVRDQILLEVSLWEGLIRFGKHGKLKSKIVRTSEILVGISPVTHKSNLPRELSNIHSTLHLSNLKKYMSDETLVIPHDEIGSNESLTFVEEP